MAVAFDKLNFYHKNQASPKVSVVYTYGDPMPDGLRGYNHRADSMHVSSAS